MLHGLQMRMVQDIFWYLFGGKHKTHNVFKHLQYFNKT